MKTPNSRQASSGVSEQHISDSLPFSPIFPKPSSLAGKALNLLLTGQTLTHPEFQTITGSWTLSASILILREAGWPIQTIEVDSSTSEYPERIIAKYLLPLWAIKEAERLRHA